MRGISASLALLSLLALIVIAYPVASPYRKDRISLELSARASTISSSLSHGHEYTGTDLLRKRSGTYGISIPQQHSDIRRARVARIVEKQRRFAATQARGKFQTEKRHPNSRVIFGKAARAVLDEFHLHGKDRKKVKQYHKAIMKAEMRIHGAESGRVFHLVHEGGNNPNEKKHITAGLYNKAGEQIPSPWTLKASAENSNLHTKGLFHLYPESHPGLKVPSVFTAAAEKSQQRKKTESEAANLRADAKKKAQIDAQKRTGTVLSQEEKKSLRKARKEAKRV